MVSKAHPAALHPLWAKPILVSEADSSSIQLRLLKAKRVTQTTNGRVALFKLESDACGRQLQRLEGYIAQPVEQQTFNLMAVGSNPTIPRS